MATASGLTPTVGARLALPQPGPRSTGQHDSLAEHVDALAHVMVSTGQLLKGWRGVSFRAALTRGERCVQSWSELGVGQRPFPGIRLRIVFAGDRLFRLFGAHPQQPKKESPGPRRPVVLLAVRAVTESAESQSETTSTPESLEGH